MLHKGNDLVFHDFNKVILYALVFKFIPKFTNLNSAKVSTVVVKKEMINYKRIEINN